MAEKNPNKLYDNIKAIQDSLEAMKNIVDDIKDKVKATLNDSNEFGGVISRVFKEQLGGYLTPKIEQVITPIQELIDGDRIPGSLKDLTIFLDSVPLAMIREEPDVSELASPVVPENVSLNTPVGQVESDVDELPQNASYQTGVKEEQDSESPKETPQEVRESRKRYKNTKLKESITKYQVVRTSDMGSLLDGNTSNIEGTVVYEFNSKDEADSMADKLNATLTQEEKELVGTEYSVKECCCDCEK